MRLETVADVHAGDGEVVVRTLEVGLCGTDRAIDDGSYGSVPNGRETLVVGHEVVGVVETPAPGLPRGTYVTATVRRPCSECANCAAGDMDACTSGRFLERGIVGLDGFASEVFVERPENLVAIPGSLGRLGVLSEPMAICERGLRLARAVGHRQGWMPRRAIVLGVGAVGMLTVYLLRLAGIETWALARGPATSERAALVRDAGGTYVSAVEQPLTRLARAIGGADLIMEAAGDPDLALEAMAALADGGVLCLRGIDANERVLPLRSTMLTYDFVLGNKAVFGSTNAGRQDWPAAVSALESIARAWPGALRRIVGSTVAAERFRAAFASTAVKATVRFS